MQQQWPQLTTDIADMKRQQVAASATGSAAEETTDSTTATTTTSTTATTIGSAAEEGSLLDGLRTWVTRWLTNYPIPFL